MGDGQTPAPPQPHRALPHSGSAHLPSSPLEIVAGSGGAMGTPPVEVRGAHGTRKNQHKAAFFQRRADGMANLCANSSCLSGTSSN